MFRAMFSPIFRSNFTVYTASVQCTDLLLTGDTVEKELSSISTGAPVHYAKAVYTVKLLLKMGENIARNT
jgi:hypothetical protein